VVIRQRCGLLPNYFGHLLHYTLTVYVRPCCLTEKCCVCNRLSVVHLFSDEQVDCLCEALLQQYPGSRNRLVTLISSLSSSQLQRCDSEHLLRARAVVAFHTGRFTELYSILSGSHGFNPAHHPLLQKVYTPQNTHTLAILSLLLLVELILQHRLIKWRSSILQTNAVFH